MIEDVLKEMKDNMNKAIEALHTSLGKIRTGRASLSLLEGIRVNYYGTVVPLNQAATLSVPESKLIVIQPWEPKSLVEIEKAILKADLGLTPINDGKIIRIAIPPLTEERRKELVKVVKKIAEETRVSLRNSRRDANEMLKELEKEKEISEDDFHTNQNKVQKITDEYIEKVSEILSRKEKEIMEV
ncbi:MAG: ribosome recycling factor [Deltaproteobacteria bacterium]|nr:MAG: ribosome recycling factor [Deltaproteobacteria bacterium]